MKTIDDLREQYPDSDWLEDRGQFSRVTTDPEESAWYCTLCGSLNCDAHEGRCYDCDDEYDDCVCGTCGGCGEGQYDGTSCSACGGKGVPRKARDYESDIEDYRERTER